jgi:cytochrome b
MSAGTAWIKVWDPLVRIGHWMLVAGFFTAYLTEDDFLAVHVWAGYLVATVVAVRVAWGLIGTRHARFGDFVRSPAVVLDYVRDVVRRRAVRYLGHNPAGGAMIVALLVCLAVTAGSGLVLFAVEEGAGPLAPLLAGGIGHGTEDAWEAVHELAANFTLLLVVLHVLGVAFSSLAHRENLVWSMITGRKRAEPAGATSSAETGSAALSRR